MTSTAAPTVTMTSRWSQYYALTKPRVVQLIVFCALIGILIRAISWINFIPKCRRNKLTSFKSCVNTGG
jgi:heme O synthase-like polyprenyltransferase